MRINYEKWTEHWIKIMREKGTEYGYIVAAESIMACGQYSDAQKIKMMQLMRNCYKEVLREKETK